MLYGSAVILGLISSLHCVGMCGPIALMLPYSNRTQILKETLTYNIGRVAMYSLQGLLFGFLSRGLAVIGFQQSLSVLFGLMLIVFAIFSFNAENKIANFPVFKYLNKKVREAFSKILKHKNGFFLLGALNGVLPCGIVYWAIAASMLTFDAFGGALYMLIFGIGTMPLMVGTVVAGNYLKKSAIRKLYRFVPFYQFALGVFLIWRAYNVDPSVFWMLTPAPVCH
jgi:uncharacterized protein